ncbi:Esterase/lipase superfamily enzyme [Chitinophaga jiangningensis]|uniref:Esterase/lipase superfamily enzyme n=1 Tax=Chitinophaga jiangningensis TaxID=1419482 RepID=A0A1M7CCK0_9BACT|nr:alpha/beta hydrolase-fold protein [Chitinophaga jiangningensis]SHL64923.1 Esterase/lipase superfamily enzyme [Chitinophaga jiangningensis]
MTENFYKWHSPSIDREFEMLVFGHAGYPLLLFPTSMGRYYESKDMGLIESIRWFIEQGRIKVYCPDSFDTSSWYNKHITPAERAYNHVRYDRLLTDEIYPRIVEETGYSRIATAGCSFGGFHAASFSFRHPEIVSYLFSLSGTFDIKSRVDGHYDDNVYFSNPADFMPGNQHQDLWRMGIILGVADNDVTRSQNEQLSGMLAQKNITHWLDIRPASTHDWATWKTMLPGYLALIR